MQNGAFSSLILFMKGANEMNYPTNAVINSVPAASELRKVAGFNPLKFLRRTTSERTGEKVLKLDLPYKRLWFRLACPNGRMVVKPLRVNDQMAVFEAMVYASKDDPEPLARFTSTVSAQEVPDGKFVQAAQDAALNEALENAGFGIQLCDLVEGSGTARYGSEVPLSAVKEARNAAPAQPQGIKQTAPAAEVRNAAVTPAPAQTPSAAPKAVETAKSVATETPVSAPEPVAQPIVAEPVMQEQPAEHQAPDMSAMNELLGKRSSAVVTDFPMSAPAAQEEVVAVTSEPKAPAIAVPEEPTVTAADPEAPSYMPDMTVEQICERMTLDEARNYVVNSGVCKGWTLAQVAERRAPSLRFYVFSDNGDNVLKAAATIVLNDMGMRKAG